MPLSHTLPSVTLRGYWWLPAISHGHGSECNARVTISNDAKNCFRIMESQVVDGIAKSWLGKFLRKHPQPQSLLPYADSIEYNANSHARNNFTL